jgi:hypothetical protein
MEFPTDAERDYLIAFDAVAIVITDNPFTVRITHDPKRVLAALRPGWPRVRIHEIVWTSPAKRARQLVGCMHTPVTSAGAAVVMVEIATELRIELTSNSVAVARARAGVARLDALLAKAKNAGLLKFFHRAYQAHRLAGGVVPYGFAYARLRRALARRIAKDQDIPWESRQLLASCGLIHRESPKRPP